MKKKPYKIKEIEDVSQEHGKIRFVSKYSEIFLN